jgi:hypothetical protein
LIGLLLQNGAIISTAGDKSESSAKSKHALWATKQMEAIGSDPSKKFMGQLNKIFNNRTVDLSTFPKGFKPLLGIS